MIHSWYQGVCGIGLRWISPNVNTVRSKEECKTRYNLQYYCFSLLCRLYVCYGNYHDLWMDFELHLGQKSLVMKITSYCVKLISVKLISVVSFEVAVILLSVTVIFRDPFNTQFSSPADLGDAVFCSFQICEINSRYSISCNTKHVSYYANGSTHFTRFNFLSKSVSSDTMKFHGTVSNNN